MAKTIGIIQARIGSSRLPAKILAPLAGRPLLDQLYARIAPARVDEWWLATSSDPSDDVTEAWGFDLGLRVFRGDLDDVLSRFRSIGSEADADWVVRITADNPFTDHRVIDALLDARDASEESKAAEVLQHGGGMLLDEAEAGQGAGIPAETPEGPLSAAAPKISPRLPVGYGVQIVRRYALERAAREIPANEPHHRVHVTSWLAQNAQVLDVPWPIEWPDRPDWRWTVDTYEDLAMARSAFRLFGDRASDLDYPAMVAILDQHPEITSMNAHIRQKPLEAG